MKYVLKLIKVLFIGLIWSILYAEGIRSIMLQNWRFDIIKEEHWQFAWRLWLDGWVIDEPREWAFVIILFTIIPLWLTGWTAIALVPWGKLFKKVIDAIIKTFKRIFKRPPKIKYTKTKVKKKKSYKQTRPPSVRGNIVQHTDEKDKKESVQKATKETRTKLPVIQSDETPSATKALKDLELPTKPLKDDFDFDFDDGDDDDDFDFDFGDDDIEDMDTFVSKPKKSTKSPKTQSQKTNNQRNDRKTPSKAASSQSSDTVSNLFNSKGYKIINNAQINGEKFDYIAVSNDEIYVCKLDSEKGDWLADEEKFNNEAPLWFSESSHRVSPVKKVLDAKSSIEKSFKSNKLRLNIIPMVTVIRGNIINAEDMLDIWDDLEVLVCRADKGEPDDLKTISEVVKKGSDIDNGKFSRVKKVISNL